MKRSKDYLLDKTNKIVCSSFEVVSEFNKNFEMFIEEILKNIWNSRNNSSTKFQIISLEQGTFNNQTNWIKIAIFYLHM